MLPRGLDGQLVRIRIPWRVRREHRGIDTAGVHLAERVVLGVRGDLTVPGRRGVASVPEVDLGVDDQHAQLLVTAWVLIVASGPWRRQARFDAGPDVSPT